LSSTERGYLKRYAGENGLTLSKYITAEIAARLLAEGIDIAAKAAENFFSFDVCNRTRMDAWVAISNAQGKKRHLRRQYATPKNLEIC
jgi:hypothetical protein